MSKISPFTKCHDDGAPRLAVLWIAACVAGCGSSTTEFDGGGTGGDAGRGGDGGSGPPRLIESVTLDVEALEGTHLGQRWFMDATAWDELGEPIMDVSFQWTSSNPSIADVDDEGMVTAVHPGATTINASVAGHTDSVALMVRSALPSDDGEMYTTWFARSDDAAVAIVDGRLAVFDVYHGGVPPTTPWPHPGVDRLEWAGDRVAILCDVANGQGTLRVLDRAEEWTVLHLGDAMGVQFDGERIATLTAGGALHVRDGIHGVPTTLVPSGVDQFRLHGDRVAILDDDGRFLVRDGAEGPFVEVATGVRTFELHGNRIAVLLEAGDGELRVKDGIEGAWTMLDIRVSKVELDGNRIGVLRKDGVARIKDGIDGEWEVLSTSYVEDLQLEGNRVAIQFEVGDLRVKDVLDGPWSVLSTSPRSFELQGDHIGMLTQDGELWFRVGLEGSWVKVEPAGAVSQFVPIADVPVPPARTTPARYGEGQSACVGDGMRCKPASEPALPFPDYGRFCGTDRPLPIDWEWANGPLGGPLDALDALCMHHDHAGAWYAESQAVSPEACIVRYGLAHARLTQDGEVVPAGTDAYDGIMGKMPNLRDALESSDAYVVGCTIDQLQAFSEANRSTR
ncbi:MAG: Ig-like domain-containing protein [Polyangiales bacterium]